MLAALVSWVVGVVEGRLVACSQVVASRGACTQQGDNTTHIPHTSGDTHRMDLQGGSFGFEVNIQDDQRASLNSFT